jgi:hypothetical protein
MHARTPGIQADQASSLTLSVPITLHSVTGQGISSLYTSCTQNSALTIELASGIGEYITPPRKRAPPHTHTHARSHMAECAKPLAGVYIVYQAWQQRGSLAIVCTGLSCTGQYKPTKPLFIPPVSVERSTLANKVVRNDTCHHTGVIAAGSPSWSQMSSISFQTPDCPSASTCSYTAINVRESSIWIQDGPLVVNCTSGTGTCCVHLHLCYRICVRRCVCVFVRVRVRVCCAERLATCCLLSRSSSGSKLPVATGGCCWYDLGVLFHRYKVIDPS